MLGRNFPSSFTRRLWSGVSGRRRQFNPLSFKGCALPFACTRSPCLFLPFAPPPSPCPFSLETLDELCSAGLILVFFYVGTDKFLLPEVMTTNPVVPCFCRVSLTPLIIFCPPPLLQALGRVLPSLSARVSLCPLSQRSIAPLFRRHGASYAFDRELSNSSD